MQIRTVLSEDWAEWLRMRRSLWTEADESHLPEMEMWLADPEKETFVAVRPDGRLGGFLEAGLRPYADGCATSPVGYIEGWYVDTDLRQQGVGASLVRAAEDWARRLGCREMASDADLDNISSQYAHLALGYAEVGRIVQFCKSLEQG